MDIFKWLCLADESWLERCAVLGRQQICMQRCILANLNHILEGKVACWNADCLGRLGLFFIYVIKESTIVTLAELGLTTTSLFWVCSDMNMKFMHMKCNLCLHKEKSCISVLYLFEKYLLCIMCVLLFFLNVIYIYFFLLRILLELIFLSWILQTKFSS